MKIKYPYPIKDWKDETAYPGEQTTPQQWAWEFLRRNPKYQEDYANCKDDLLLSQKVATKYGLQQDRLPDPKGNDSDLFFDYYPKVYFLSESDPYLQLKPTEDKLVLVIDLKQSISEQLEIAKRFITSQEEAGKNRIREDHYIDYLRVLDAKSSQDSKVTNEQIIKAIYPNYENGKDQLKNHFKAAKLLRDKNYLSISNKQSTKINIFQSTEDNATFSDQADCEVIKP